jgi:hypothetical protein
MSECIMSAAERERFRNYRQALDHWLRVGYSYETARALAATLHGADEDVRQWARWMMTSRTNLRLEDML